MATNTQRSQGIKQKMKQKTLSSYIKALDKVFSEYIRQRDSNHAGIGKCITCNWHGHWKEADCGHFVSRAEKSVRWDEKNCALQCKRCNGFRGGEQFLFAKEIDKKYGNGTAEKLQLKRHQTVKLSTFELQAMIDHYKTLLKSK